MKGEIHNCYHCKRPITEAADGQIMDFGRVKFHPQCWHDYSSPERAVTKWMEERKDWLRETFHEHQCKS